jgi:hypothetical protein
MPGLKLKFLKRLPGTLLDDDERDEIDTLGGLVCALAGRVPGRGEVVRHRGGLQFEILEGDPRRVTLLKLRGLPRVKTSSSKPTKNRPIVLFWHLFAGAFASLSLPPLFLLPAIFALSIPLLAYLKAESRMQASMIFGAAGTGWFLASTYWVSHSLISESPSLWVLAPFMALALALILALFWASAAMVSWSFGRRPVARLVLVCCIFQPW